MVDFRRVGIITMHRVQNVGSVLQAYALCEKIKQIGARCELIDYQYPNDTHRSTCHKTNLISRLLLFFSRVKFYLLYDNTVQKHNFNKFRNKYLLLSKYYPTKEDLNSTPPEYDVYMTGSDQVWNPRFTKGDGAFFFDFIKDGYKVAYASSFSISDIPLEYRDNYRSLLETYSHISVRETSGVRIIKELIDKDVHVVCDPTLLLTKEDYLPLISESVLNKKPKQYILVYALSYAYDPYPQIEEVIKKVKKQLDLPVIYLHANTVDHYRFGSSITSAGPCEFLDLFYHATFVVSSSFHGVAFAINFKKPFVAIVPSKHDDSRIMSLLYRLGLENKAILTNQSLPSKVDTELDEKYLDKLGDYREDSILYLKKVLTYKKR